MTKKFTLTVLAGFLLFGMTGCAAIQSTYPHIEFRNSSYNFDILNKTILLKDGYVLNDENPYSTVETDSGYDIVIHLVPSDKEMSKTEDDVFAEESTIEETPPHIFQASDFLEMSIDEADFYDGKDIRMVDAAVQRIDFNLELLLSDVGYVHFDNGDDVYKVRVGEKITFEGELYISPDGGYSFRGAKFVSVNS